MVIRDDPESILNVLWGETYSDLEGKLSDSNTAAIEARANTMIFTRPLKLIFSFWSYPSFLHDAGRWVIEIIGLCSPFMKSPYCICNIMPFVAALTFVMYQKIHLLLDDITEVATEGNDRCFGGLWMHRTSFHFSKLHNSHFLHGNSCK